MKILIFIIITVFQTMVAVKDIVPVFMLDYDDVMNDMRNDNNPFSKMSSTDFGDVVHEVIKRSDGIVIFIEETLCPEDLSSRDKLGTPFFNLRQGLLEDKVKYFPRVIDPYVTLNQIFEPQPNDVFFLNVGTKLQLRDKFKYIYVFFQDTVNESRTQALRRHDLIMKQVLFLVKQLKSGPMVAFYTGKFNPMVVQRLPFVPIEPIAEPVERDVFIRSDRALFRFRDVQTVSVSRRSTYRQIPVVSSEISEPYRLRTTMAYSEFELQFNFEFNPDKWMLDSVSLIEAGEEVGRSMMFVSVLWDWSYVCAEPMTIVNRRDGSSVTISQYQIQPIRRGDGDTAEVFTPIYAQSKLPPTEDIEADLRPEEWTTRATTVSSEKTDTPKNDTTFGKAVNCGPYFSSVILSALFVTFICLAVLAYGIIMLFDCGSNDRFDDASGKPLSWSEAQHKL